MLNVPNDMAMQIAYARDPAQEQAARERARLLLQERINSALEMAISEGLMGEIKQMASAIDAAIDAAVSDLGVDREKRLISIQEIPMPEWGDPQTTEKGESHLG